MHGITFVTSDIAYKKAFFLPSTINGILNHVKALAAYIYKFVVSIQFFVDTDRDLRPFLTSSTQATALSPYRWINCNIAD